MQNVRQGEQPCPRAILFLVFRKALYEAKSSGQYLTYIAQYILLVLNLNVE